MGHFLQAFIGKHDVLNQIVKEYEQARMIPLPQGFGLLPLIEAFIESVHAHSQTSEHRLFPEFEYLSDALAVMAARYSYSGEITYVETEYFGGEGGQGAVIWRNSIIVFGPQTSKTTSISIKSPISQALHQLGVQQGTEYDEFDALGLGRFRRTDRCFEAL